MVAAAGTCSATRLGVDFGARLLERRCELGRQRRLEREALAPRRVLEGERVRVEELPAKIEVVLRPVDPVAADGEPDRLEVRPDLVRAPRLEPHLEQGSLAEALPD